MPSAVGRALGIPLAQALKLPDATFDKNISYVSVGDGSTANAHFLSAVNLSKYAAFKGTKVPLVFGVSDNNMCISQRHGLSAPSIRQFGSQDLHGQWL